MVASVMFAVCMWLGWMFGRWYGHALLLLGMSLWWRLLSESLLGWHSVGVLSMSQTVGANECGAKMMSTITGHVMSGTEFSANQFTPQARSPCGSIYSGSSTVSLQCLKSP
jgi:hypothetical protein